MQRTNDGARGARAACNATSDERTNDIQRMTAVELTNETQRIERLIERANVSRQAWALIWHRLDAIDERRAMLTDHERATFAFNERAAAARAKWGVER